MQKQNQMFFILGLIGTGNIIAAIVLLCAINNTMVSVMLFVSGALLIIGGIADRKHRIGNK
ncbi:hypothetical protein SAMN04487936_107218 [Halobacillus dabanensis]|uniref:Uncharacterized protein n=1 Tax=Halobacillus dabanensis TaxID=240302 RepID=A0A1I3WZ04_HALDA|nr:hypothetical protein [Halobacillus dabanensis]SFK12600.1 hypothetical protein SAMN04487936_107218 [Halobacillus dabanensis]